MNEIIIYDTSRQVLLALTRVLEILLVIGDIEIVAYLLYLDLALLDLLHRIDQKFYLSKGAVVFHVASSE